MFGYDTTGKDTRSNSTMTFTQNNQPYDRKPLHIHYTSKHLAEKLSSKEVMNAMGLLYSSLVRLTEGNLVRQVEFVSNGCGCYFAGKKYVLVHDSAPTIQFTCIGKLD